MAISKKIWIIIVIGVLLRIILASVSYHSDLSPFDFAGWVMGKTNLLNFYDYLPSLPQESFVLKTYPANLFNYPPVVYFFLGLLSYPAALIAGQSFNEAFLFNLQSVLGSFQLFSHLLLLKLPFLIFDLGTGFLLTKLFLNPREKQIAFTLWLFNPINLYATYLIGQFDIIPVFFVVLSLVLVQKETLVSLSWQKLLLPALALGIGGIFKIYPLFLLVPLAALSKRWVERFGLILLGVLPYALMILPFLGSKGFRSTALVASQTLKSLYAQIPISGGEAIVLFPFFILFFYFLYLTYEKRKEMLWQDFFIIMLIFFVFTHYHPQWFLWLTPFLLITLIKSSFKHLAVVLVSLFSFLGLLFFFDSGLTLGLFAPIWPNLYLGPTLWEVLKINPDYNFWRSILQTAFVSCALYFIYYYFPRKSTEQ